MKRSDMVAEKIFESALGVRKPWYIAELRFELPQQKGVLQVRIDIESDARFVVPGIAGDHAVHDTVSRTYRLSSFFQHEGVFDVRVPRVKLPDGSLRVVDPPWTAKLSGLTLLERPAEGSQGPHV